MTRSCTSRTTAARRCPPAEDGSRVVEKKLPSSPEGLRRWIEPEYGQFTIARQCALVGLARSTRYYRPAGESVENLALMRRIDERYFSTTSTMPDGLLDTLQKSEILDLLAYLIADANPEHPAFAE